MGKSRKDAPLFQLIDRKMFDALVEKHDVDQGVRTFTTWEMTATLVEMMTLRLDSFRAIEETLKVPRSTLSDAMRRRLSAFFQDLCDAVLNGIRKRTTDRKVRRAIKELLAIDSSEVDVHGSLFDHPSWAKKIGKGHRASLKFHVVWNVDRGWVEDFSITGNRKHDSPVATKLRILSGKTYVFDRAYNDLGFWLKITAAGSDFVTRLKDNASLKKFRLAVVTVMDSKGVGGGVFYDGEYKPTASVISRNKNEIEDQRFRHIIYRDPETKKIFDFVTSNFNAKAQEIADIYKRRWAVELLFRWLKGHLNLRRLPVKSVNASEVLMAAAVLVMLLLQLKKILEKFGGTLWQLLRSIRSALNREALSRRGCQGECRWLLAPEADFPS